jgi:hypothetical protein
MSEPSEPVILDPYPGLLWTIREGYTIGEGSHPVPCRSCASIVLFVKTRTGAHMPIDPDGTSHFATCPQAARWRKPR